MKQYRVVKHTETNALNETKEYFCVEYLKKDVWKPLAIRQYNIRTSLFPYDNKEKVIPKFHAQVWAETFKEDLILADKETTFFRKFIPFHTDIKDEPIHWEYRSWVPFVKEYHFYTFLTFQYQILLDSKKRHTIIEHTTEVC